MMITEDSFIKGSHGKSCFPNAEIAVFEDASHFHHVEKEKEFLETLRDFLEHND